MAAFDGIFILIRSYFKKLGYNPEFIDDYFSGRRFSEVLCIKLANANIVNKNKTYRSSHQSHIAITGEAIEFFYSSKEFEALKIIEYETRNVTVARANLDELHNIEYNIPDTCNFELLTGEVTLGKRTQSQVQFSKKNSQNFVYFNKLREGLFENDYMILLKCRWNDTIFCVGISDNTAESLVSDFQKMYDVATYLRVPEQ